MNENERNSFFQAVTDVQKLIYTISQVNSLIPRVIPDGIYGPETTEAVTAFQHIYGLPETGKVDAATYRALYDEYVLAKEQLGEPKMISPFSGRFKNGMLSKGDKCDTVCIIQAMFEVIRFEYNCLPELKITGIFNSDTENAVKLFQKINFLEPTGNVDRKTWDRLADSYNKYVKYEM